MTTPTAQAGVRLAALVLLLLGTIAALPAGGEGGARAAGALELLATDGTPDAGRPVVITAPNRPRHAAPSGEQVLRLAGPADGPASLAPAVARDAATSFLVRQVFRGLIRLEDGLVPVPELAERIEISADGLVYTFRLHPAATFQDGRGITAADVVFSFTHALSPKAAGGDAALLKGPDYLSDIAGAADVVAGRTEELSGARAIDERTVELTLAAPRATFLMKLAGAPASVIDRRDVARRGEWWRSPNGSGPFRVASWLPDESLTLVAFDDFFAGPPLLERVEIRLGPNAAQPFNLYQANQIDVVTVPASSVDLVLDPAGEFGDELTVTPALATSFLAFRPDMPPMDDPHVRRAVWLAFPHRKVAEVTYAGHKLAADGLLPPGVLGREWPVEVAPHDPAAARAELAASSYGSAAAVPPLRIYGGSVRGAEALREVLEAELGLRVEVVAVDWQEFNDGLARRDYPAFELLWAADYPDPESFVAALFGSDSPSNFLGYRNDAVDELVREAAGKLDVEGRAELYARAQQLLAADHVLIPLYHDVRYTLAKPYVRGLEVTPLGHIGLDGVWMER